MFGSSLSDQPLQGQTVIIVAGGPSVNLKDIRAIAMARAADRCRVIAVNDAVYLCWFADYLHACDRRWWEANYGVPGFKGVKTSLENTSFSDVQALTNTGIEGYDPTPGCLRSGSNSGYQAVHLAAKLGAAKIVTLGLDFTGDGARMHWFGLHTNGMDKHSNAQEWRRLFRRLTDELSAKGVDVLNAGLKSTLTWLPQMDLSSQL